MSFRKFRKVVLKYFKEYSVVNNKLVKESIQFYDDSCLLGQTYGVRFIFDGHKVILEYTTIREKLNWELAEDYTGLYYLNYGAEVWNLGRTIEECCDYLWEIE